ncbi:hypothetical protein KIN20_023429 [Parelaphostrongylus tenuis]|uniref:MIF4G domain-containing protein n=1 Tax=Parelaphostrongylus tenuis TaxID=148309 RepID=A0AAD5NC68_PARTN|nr:hypothetical protein KIN20_023429 [Parelaphostrongylus tenuis]
MGDRWNYQHNHQRHQANPSYNEWSYDGYQQQVPPRDYSAHNNFSLSQPQYSSRGHSSATQSNMVDRGTTHYVSAQQQQQQRPGSTPSFPLNPNAAAFIPRGYNQLNQSGPAMPYYQNDEADVRAYEAMYNHFPNGTVLDEYIPSHDLHQDMVHSDNLVSLQEIQVGVEQILSDADDFDSWAGAIRDRMTEKRMSPPTRVVAVRMIFEMAVTVAPRPLSGNNPQHALARLLHFLTLEIPSLLRDAVLKLLCDFHSKRQTFNPELRVNLAIFFAEIYEKMETESGGRIDKVGEALLEQLDDLLKFEMNDQLMKTIVQLVKLCGRNLDAYDVTEPSVSQLLTKLVAFAKGHPQLSESVKTQIMSVVELRKNGWGVTQRASGTTSDAAPSSSSLSVLSNDGDYVGENGVALELSEEERSFLESHLNAIDGLDDPEQDQSFDEQEVLKDFGAFVKEEEDRKTTSMLEKLKVCDQDN